MIILETTVCIIYMYSIRDWPSEKLKTKHADYII